MIDIVKRSNQERLDTNASTNIVVDVINPIIRDNLLEGSLSYDFSLPTSPKNRNELGYHNMISLKDDPQNLYDANLMVNKTKWFNGEMKITSANKDSFKARFNVDFGNFKRLVENTKLPDVFDGGDTFSFSKTATDYYYYEGKFTNVNEIVSGDVLAEVFVDAVLIASINKQADPFLTVTVIDEVFQAIVAEVNKEEIPNYTASWRRDGDDRYFYLFPKVDNHNSVVVLRLTDLLGPVNIACPRLQYSKLNITQNEFDDFVFPSVFDGNFYDGRNPEFTGLINAWNADDTEYFVSTPGTGNLYTLVPYLKVRLILQKIFDFAGYTWEGSFKTDAEIGDLVLYNTFSLDAKAVWEADFNEMTTEMIYKNHVPDITVLQFLEILRDLFCLDIRFSYEDKNCKINFRKDIFTSDSQDWTAYHEQQNIVIEEKQEIVLKYIDNLNPKVDGEFFFEPISSGNDFPTSRQITVNCGSLRYNDTYDAIDDLRGNSPLFELGQNNPFPVRFLFWRGLVNDVPTGTAKPDNTNDYSLVWKDSVLQDKTLYDNFWKEWAEFLKTTKEVNFLVWLNQNELANLDTEKLLYIVNQRYLLATARVQIDNRKNSLSRPLQVKAFKV